MHCVHVIGVAHSELKYFYFLQLEHSAQMSSVPTRWRIKMPELGSFLQFIINFTLQLWDSLLWTETMVPKNMNNT